MLIIIFSIIFDIFISHIPELIAEDDDWSSAGNLLNKKEIIPEQQKRIIKLLRQIDSNYVNAWDGKGWALNELGNYTQAIT